METGFERWDEPTEEDLEAYARLMATAFGTDPASSARWLGRIGARRARVVTVDGELGAALASYDAGHWFGGRAVPCWAVAGVAVQPHLRRRGLASAAMKRCLQDGHRQGLPLSSLFAANHHLYRSVGYELAGSYAEASVAPDRIRLREPGGTMRPMGENDEPLRQALYQRMARTRGGHLAREAGLWRRATHDRDDAPLAGWLAVSSSGEPEGYLSLQAGHGTGLDQELRVADLVAISPWAVRKLLAFLGDHASVVSSVRFPSGPACPFLRSLPEPRVSWPAHEGWLLRVVSLLPALELRGWPGAVAGRVDIELDDPLLPGNAGRWVLELAAGEMRARPGGTGAVRMRPRGLATVYSGQVTPAEAAAVGLMEGPADALSTLGAMFSGPRPWVLERY
jgi:predicted acetyltransferase